MGLTSRLFLAFGVVIALAAAAAVYGMSVVSRTTGDVVQLYDGPLMAVGHARSRQLNFPAGVSPGGADKAAAERGMTALLADMGVVRDRMPASERAPVDKALELVQAWHNGGAAAPKTQDVDDALDVMAEGASAYGFNFRTEAEAQ